VAVLHVRDVPDELYARLRELAQRQRRSLSAEVVVLLEDASREGETRRSQAQILADARRSQAQILADLDRLRASYRPPVGAPDTTALLREDRER